MVVWEDLSIVRLRCSRTLQGAQAETCGYEVGTDAILYGPVISKGTRRLIFQA